MKGMFGKKQILLVRQFLAKQFDSAVVLQTGSNIMLYKLFNQIYSLKKTLMWHKRFLMYL